MSDANAVLFANDAFYMAFATGDMAAMRAVWADDPGITCVHPGWQPLIGQDDVMASWEAILSSGETMDVRCDDAHAHMVGDVAYVTAFERLPGAVLTATNLFVRKGSLWRMIHHQAGPCQDAPPPTPAAGDPTLQ